MAGPAASFDYVSDDGTTYKMRMDSSNAAAAGNTAAAAGRVSLPHGYHPRYVLATHPTTGRERRIAIGSPTNALFVGPGSGTISLEYFGTSPSSTVTYNVFSRVGEKRYNKG